MTYSKSFPRYVEKNAYPVWEEVQLTKEEEKEIEKKAVIENIANMEKSLSNAKNMFERKDLKEFQSDMVKVAIALFEKRARHLVYFKESKCRSKFNKTYKK